MDLQFTVTQAEVTDPERTPPVATQYTTYPEITCSTKPRGRYVLYDTTALHGSSTWHTNLFGGTPWLVATGSNTTMRGSSFIRQTIPVWGVDIRGPSAQFFRVDELP